MPDTQAVLEKLRFELQFLEDGGYGRSPRIPWRPPFVFEDSPSCMNFNNAGQSHPCEECFLTQFVPKSHQGEKFPCRHIPLTESGETVMHFYESSTQIELEEALRQWLMKRIAALEEQPAFG